MRANIITAILTILFSVFFLISALNIPNDRSSIAVGPAEWPIMILSFMMAMGILLLITSIRDHKKGISENGEAVELSGDDLIGDRRNPNIVKGGHWYILLAIAIYILLLPIIGFLFVTPVLFLFLAWLLGLKKKRILILVTVIAMSTFVLLFIYALNIPFPRGIGIFRSISFLVY